jgi:hypothetical protein
MSEKLDLLTEAFFRKSYMMLDAVGIHVTVSDLPSAAEYRAASDACYPRGRLRRFLLWLRPKERARRFERLEYWRTVRQTEFLNRIMDEAREMMDAQDSD